MRLLARLHPLLIVTVLLVAIFVGGVFWEAPFQTGAQGVARLFSQAWEYGFWPVRFVVTRLEGAGVKNIELSDRLAFDSYILAQEAAIDGRGLAMTIGPFATDEIRLVHDRRVAHRHRERRAQRVGLPVAQVTVLT